MSDHNNEVEPRTPDHVVSPLHGHLTAADLVRLAGIEQRSDQAREITVKIETSNTGSPERRGDDLLRRFVPYFVIATMSMILLGGLAALLGLIIPPIMAMVITLVGSLVSIILSLVVTIIAGVIAAVGIGYLQTINRKIDDEDDQ